jgi:hypothetical protein
MKYVVIAIGIMILVLVAAMIVMVGHDGKPADTATSRVAAQQTRPDDTWPARVQRFRALCDRLDNTKMSELTPNDIRTREVCQILEYGEACAPPPASAFASVAAMKKYLHEDRNPKHLDPVWTGRCVAAGLAPLAGEQLVYKRMLAEEQQRRSARFDVEMRSLGR